MVSRPYGASRTSSTAATLVRVRLAKVDQPVVSRVPRAVGRPSATPLGFAWTLCATRRHPCEALGHRKAERICGGTAVALPADPPMADGGGHAHAGARDPVRDGVLHGLVRDHFAAFAEQMHEDGHALLRHVVAEFEAFLPCGVLACGFMRTRCPGCGFGRLVAFSCKTAARQCDRMLLLVPYRRWVLSLPRALRRCSMPCRGGSSRRCADGCGAQAVLPRATRSRADVAQADRCHIARSDRHRCPSTPSVARPMSAARLCRSWACRRA